MTCRRCIECADSEHHWSTEMLGFATQEPDHPAAKAGCDVWFECKHCDAWAAVCEDCCEEPRAPGLDVCHGCSEQGRADDAADLSELQVKIDWERSR